MIQIVPDWAPEPAEAVAMSGIYGLVTLLLIFVLAGIITPSADSPAPRLAARPQARRGQRFRAWRMRRRRSGS